MFRIPEGGKCSGSLGITNFQDFYNIHNILTITLSLMFCPNTNDPLDGLIEDLKGE